MKDILKKISKEHKIAGIFTEDPDSFLEGYVECVDKDMFILSHITNMGIYDGYILKLVKRVFQITTDDRYGKKIEALYKIRGQSHMPISVSEEKSAFDNFVEFARSNHFIISVELHYDDENIETGYIKDFSKEYLQIVNIDQYGYEDGESIILAEDITTISCDTDIEHTLSLLVQNNI